LQTTRFLLIDKLDKRKIIQKFQNLKLKKKICKTKDSFKKPFDQKKLCSMNSKFLTLDVQNLIPLQHFWVDGFFDFSFSQGFAFMGLWISYSCDGLKEFLFVGVDFSLKELRHSHSLSL
jgi:hypothetical protein